MLELRIQDQDGSRHDFLGSAHYDLRCLEENVPMDLWLNLKDGGISSAQAVNIGLLWTPATAATQ